MFFNRVVYIIISAAAVAAFLITDSSVALFLCICLAVLPVLSLVMLSVAAKRVRFDYEMRESCIRGQALQITMNASVKPRFLVGSVQVVMDVENSTFHKIHRKKFQFKDLTGSEHVYDFVSSDSGRIDAHVKSVRLIDIFGVCSISVNYPKFSESIVSPVLYEDATVTVGRGRTSSSGEISLPEKGYDNSEIFGVRDYVSGDSLRAIHWKLSSRFDTLKTKEFGSSYDHQTLILVDMSRFKGGAKASDEQLNAVLDTAISISHSLKESGYLHSIGWFDEGTFRSSEVSDGETFVGAVSALMSIKVSEQDEKCLLFLSRVPESAAFNKIIYVTTASTEEERHEHFLGSVTEVCVGKESGVADGGGVKVVNMNYEDIGSQLMQCEL